MTIKIVLSGVGLILTLISGPILLITGNPQLTIAGFCIAHFGMFLTSITTLLVFFNVKSKGVDSSSQNSKASKMSKSSIDSRHSVDSKHSMESKTESKN